METFPQKHSKIYHDYLALFVVFLLSSGCSPKKTTNSPDTSSNTVHVLSYSSMRGKASLGEYLSTNFPKFCKGCQVEFHHNADNASLFSQLKTLQKRNSLNRFDVVMGLDESEIGLTQKLGLIESSIVYDQSPMIFLADTQKLPKARWPKSWKDLPKKLPKQTIAQDPRLSSPGLLLLRTLLQKNFLSLLEFQSSIGQYYPSWSASYQAFTHEAYPLVWTYLSSEAYHRCNDSAPTRDRYQAVPLKEGYPMQKEHAAPIRHEAPKNATAQFMNFLRTPSVQQQIPLSNWMLPALPETPLPDCFKNLSRVDTFDLPEIKDEQTLLSWKDLWSQ